MIDIRPAADPQDIRTRLIDILMTHAQDNGTPFVMQDWGFEAWDGDVYLGGVFAKAGKEWLYVELLAVAPEARGRGVGKQLMQQVEDKARDMNRTGIFLDTFAFQAPAFYKTLGYEEFGKIDAYMDGHPRHFLCKQL
ncbi:GNAT family N-acetyltransferase [Pacificibacter sp. AS14]|uniref:GNAT family N-acetyltransferase n=1 Tax=Pacificibacter sp. AS14 TaxID=3135785 RepID=UPI00316C2699